MFSLHQMVTFSDLLRFLFLPSSVESLVIFYRAYFLPIFFIWSCFERLLNFVIFFTMKVNSAHKLFKKYDTLYLYRLHKNFNEYQWITFSILKIENTFCAQYYFEWIECYFSLVLRVKFIFNCKCSKSFPSLYI